MIEIDLCRTDGGSSVSPRQPDLRSEAAVVAGTVERGRQQVKEHIDTHRRAVLERHRADAAPEFEEVRVLDLDGFYADGDERDECGNDGC